MCITTEIFLEVKQWFYKENQVKREKITDVEAEITRFTDAKETAKEQLKGFYEKEVKEVGEVNAAIFEVHQM